MNEIVKTILEQLGGRKTLLMTGAKVHSYSDYNLVLKLPIGLIKMFEVTYDEGSDLYTVRTYNTKYTLLKQTDDVYAEDLVPMFERETGLYTRL
jgi:hypothetical protein